MGGAGGQDEGGRGKPPEKENVEMHLQKLFNYKDAYLQNVKIKIPHTTY